MLLTGEGANHSLIEIIIVSKILLWLFNKKNNFSKNKYLLFCTAFKVTVCVFKTFVISWLLSEKLQEYVIDSSLCSPFTDGPLCQ